MRRLGFAALMAAGIVVMGHAETRKVDFTQDAVDQPPKGFEFGHTAGVGKPGRWIVQADGTNKVLAQADPDSTRSRFPVAVLSDVTAADVDLSVRFKPISGRVDQAAGLVWRYQNQDNYYIVRANALEDNVVLTRSKAVSARTFRSKARADLWQEERGAIGPVEHAAGGRQRSAVRVYFNGTKLYEVDDATFSKPGKVGVWTKADSITQFDDLTVVTK